VTIGLLAACDPQGYRLSAVAPANEQPELLAIEPLTITKFGLRYQPGGPLSIVVKVDAQGNVVGTDECITSAKSVSASIVTESTVKQSLKRWKFDAATDGASTRLVRLVFNLPKAFDHNVSEVDVLPYGIKVRC
jgi:hypothetical protein